MLRPPPARLTLKVGINSAVVGETGTYLTTSVSRRSPKTTCQGRRDIGPLGSGPRVAILDRGVHCKCQNSVNLKGRDQEAETPSSQVSTSQVLVRTSHVMSTSFLAVSDFRKRTRFRALLGLIFVMDPAHFCREPRDRTRSARSHSLTEYAAIFLTG